MKKNGFSGSRKRPKKLGFGFGKTRLETLTEWTQLGSVAYAKTVLPLKWHHNDFRGGRDLSQNVRGGLTNPWIPSVTL